MTSSSQRRRTAALGATLLVAVALSACNKRDEGPTPGPSADSAVGQADQKTDAAQDAADRAAGATVAARDAARAASGAVADSAITARVQATLAADAELKLLDIRVETLAGRAALRGTAPNGGARDRATQLASAVEGVVAVDNQLTIVQ